MQVGFEEPQSRRQSKWQLKRRRSRRQSDRRQSQTLNPEQKRKIFRTLLHFAVIAFATRVGLTFHDEYQQMYFQTIRSFFVTQHPGLYELERRNEPDFEKIVTHYDWWEFMNFTVSENLFHTDNDPYKAQFWTENTMVGTPKLRQIRVDDKTCEIPHIVNSYFDHCYASYTPDIEYKNKTFFGVPYKTNEEYCVNPIQGKEGTYVGPGFVQNLSYSKDENMGIIKKLEDANWLDRGTRLIVLELSFYNSNLYTFAYIQLYGERLACGNILPNFDIHLLPVHSNARYDSMRTRIFGSIYLAVAVYFFSCTLWDLIRQRLKIFISKFWNWTNLTYCVCALLSFIMIHKHLINMENIINSLNGGKMDIFLEDYCDFYDTVKVTIIISTLAAWITIFRFISFSLTMSNFSIALRKGYSGIFGFSVMFMVMYVAFALLGYLLFSRLNPAFNSFSRSLDSVMRMIMTDFQYEYLEGADNFVGPIYFIIFILCMFFVLLNTFLAVIGSSYVETRQVDMTRFTTVRDFMRILSNKIKICWRRSKNKVRRSTKFGRESSPEDDDDQDNIGDNAPRDPAEIERERLVIEKENACERLIYDISHLEGEAELFIEKMDRVLQRLDAIEEKELKSTSKSNAP